MKSDLPALDTLIIGAGAAGLAAAAELTSAGKCVCVLEARDRIGGRILTRREPDLSVPLELGAEFIHGKSPAIFEWLNKSGALVADASQSRWSVQKGKLTQAQDVFDEMKQGLKRIRKPKNDLPFSEFLDGPARGKLSPRAREFARTLVEGFDAADATRVSTLQTLEEWAGESAADAPTFRPLNGYSALLEALQGALDPRQARLQLDSIVHEVRWQRGAVTIAGMQQGRPFAMTAAQAIVTLPLGVLQLPPQTPGAVRFAPALNAKQKALNGLAAGPVIKVILRFRSAFWETLDDERYRKGAFFHSPKAPFPTFWSSLPVRTGVLVAWTAGPNAARLAGSSEAEIVQLALDSLETIFGKRANVRAQLQGAYLHDWQADIFACGAYSYVTAGNTGARKALATPIQGTLFFAGEATDVEAAATVTGALQSGKRAARQVLKSPPP
jgi:monoamine oxidase